MKLRFKGIDLAFFMLSIVHTVLYASKGIGYFVYAIFALLVVYKIEKKLSNETFLLYSLFVPNKYLHLLVIPMYLILSKRLINKKLAKENILFLGYIIAFGLLNCVVYNGLVVATLFQIGFYYCIFALLDDFEKRIELKALYEVFNKMFLLQLITGVIQIIITHGYGDNVRGTLISAHYLGVFLLVYGYMLLKVKTDYLNKTAKYIRIVMVTLLFILADAKHVFVVVLVALLINKVLTALKIKNKISFSGVTILFVTIAGLIVIQSGFLNNLFSNSFISPYLFDERYNKKMVYLVNTLNEMKSWNGLFGFGVGQFGSQVSITFSKGLIYDWDNTLSFYKYGIEPFVRSIGGLMTEWYSIYGIRVSSMVLGYPLISFVGMVAELGVVGYYLMLHLFDKYFRDKNATFVITFIFLSLFDMYLEIPCVFVMILIGTFLIQNKGKLVLYKNINGE